MLGQPAAVESAHVQYCMYQKSSRRLAACVLGLNSPAAPAPAPTLRQRCASRRVAAARVNVCSRKVVRRRCWRRRRWRRRRRRRVLPASQPAPRAPPA